MISDKDIVDAAGALGIKLETSSKSQKNGGEQSSKFAVGYIYFMGSATFPDRIKIGFAMNPVERRLALEVGSPIDLMLLAFIPATRESELYFHKVFKKYRIKGEWFSAVPELWDCINLIRFNPDSLRHFGNPDYLAYMLVKRTEIIEELGEEAYWKLKRRAEG